MNDNFLKALEILGNPQNDLQYIHVAGTNGKGSVCAMLDSILRKTGRKTGLYVSPHLIHPEERISVDGVNISTADFQRLTERVSAIDTSLNFFEVLTAVAFLYFQEQKCDIVVLEVGLGGLLDPTNVIEKPLISVITHIALDHQAILGNTLEEIAYQKAGIIKPGCPSLYGGHDTLIHAEYIPDFESANHFDLPNLVGAYQKDNLAIVLKAVDILNKIHGFGITDEQVRDGLRSVKWPARFEYLSHNPDIIFDGGHNPDGIAGAVASVKSVYQDKKIILCMGVMKDKEYKTMVSMLLPIAHHFYTMTPNSPRALPAQDLAQEIIGQGERAFACLDCKDALNQAMKEQLPILFVGSLYLYADVKKALEELL